MDDTHDCMDHRERVVFEGEDVVMECCAICGKVRYERGSPDRPMAWYRAPSKSHPWFPWRYAYDDPMPGKDGDPEVWKYLTPSLPQQQGERT